MENFYYRAGRLEDGAGGPWTSACGRKRTLVLPDIGMSERPLSGKADIKLISPNRSAIDPKRTFEADRSGENVEGTDEANLR